MKAVIIAAGKGSRMLSETPKTLMPFGDRTILATIVRNIAQTGVRDFGIVVGFQSAIIRAAVSNMQELSGFSFSLIDNAQWEKGNGISVLAAETYVGRDPFLLSMCDHVVSSQAIARIAKSARGANLLLVDKRTDAVFDIDDATKVKTHENSITFIGKELTDYNGIDCGIFRLTTRFFDSMREQLTLGKESISSAVTGLIDKGDMEAVFMEADEFWSDIDTPEAYRNAQKIFL
jgi:choline kinase